MSEKIVPFPTARTLDATEIITSLADQPEYARNLEDGYGTSRALARCALELVGMEHDNHLEDTYEPDLADTTPEIALNALVGTLPAYVHGLEGIRHFHTKGKMPKQVYRSMKGRAALFNHAVKAVVEQNPTFTFSNVADTVSTIYGATNRDRWGDDRQAYEQEAKWFKTQFEGVLRGMQQEVVAHQVIETINQINPIINPQTGEKRPRVAIDTNVSVEDDLKGADMYITLDGVTFPIDIKASERTAENTRKKSSHPRAVITSGVVSIELNGAFKATTNQARKAAPAMLKKLYAAREEYIRKMKPAERALLDQQSLALAA